MKSMNISSTTGQTRSRGADGRAEDAHLRDRRVEHAAREALHETLRRAEHAAHLVDALGVARAAAGHVLAEHDHVGIALHRDRERFVDGLAGGKDARHGVTRSRRRR
jgi:hypothetical protein